MLKPIFRRQSMPPFSHLPGIASRAPFILLLVVFSMVAGCKNGNSPTDSNSEPIVSRIEMEVNSDTLKVGDQLQLKATAYNAEGAPLNNVSLTWTSTDPAIATVNGSGMVYAEKEGHVGIKATAGQTSAEANLTVEAAHFEVTLVENGIPAYQILRAAATPGLLRRTSELWGTIDGQEVAYHAVAPDTLAFVVPELEPGTYQAEVVLEGTHKAEFILEIKAPPVVEDPEEVVTTAINTISSALNSMGERADEEQEEHPEMDVARGLITLFQDRFASATPEQRKKLAMLFTANPELLRITNPDIEAQFQTPLIEVSSTSDKLEGLSPEESLNAYKKAFVISVISAVASIQALEATCPKALTGWLGLACVASAAAFSTSLFAINLTVDNILNITFKPVDDMVVELGSSTPSKNNEDFGMRVRSINRSSLVLDHAISYPMQVTASYRSLTGSDAAMPVLADLFNSFEQFTEGWLIVANIIDHIRESFDYDGPAIAEEVPVIPDQPHNLQTQPVTPEYLTMQTSGNSAVSCESENVGGQIVLTCITTETTDQHFTIELLYSSDYGNFQSGISALLQPLKFQVFLDSGDAQYAYPGEAVSDALRVRVTLPDGTPAEGVMIRWTVTAGGGSAAPATSETGLEGYATTHWTLGEVEGEQVLEANIEINGLTVGEAATFLATADRGRHLELVSGNEQFGKEGDELPESLVVRVYDDRDAPLPGEEVYWTIVDEGGSLSEDISLTDEEGRAEVIWTRGAEEQGAVFADVYNDQGELIDGAPVEFTATSCWNATEHMPGHWLLEVYPDTSRTSPYFYDRVEVWQDGNWRSWASGAYPGHTEMRSVVFREQWSYDCSEHQIVWGHNVDYRFDVDHENPDFMIGYLVTEVEMYRLELIRQ